MRKEIKLLASEYEVGDQTELLKCPSCDGGMSNDKSFTMGILPEGIVYICYRASCGIRGFIPNTRMGTSPIKEKKVKTNSFMGDISELPEMMIPFLVDKFPCMTQELLEYEQVKYSYERERILFPLFDVRGYQYGLQARSYREKPKAISYFDNGEVPKLHVPLGYRPATHVTLVEDQISAMILCSLGIPSIALLGTDLGEREAAHLAKLGIRDITVFLDADAITKAVKIQRTYPLDFNISVYYHETDPKDLTYSQIKEFQQWLKET